MSTQMWREKNKELVRLYKRKWYYNNKKKHIKGGHKRRKLLKKWLYEYKSTQKCKLCPENHPAALDFHHKNPKEKNGEVAALVHRGWSQEKIMEEIKKCEVLCANCHRKLHYVPVV